GNHHAWRTLYGADLCWSDHSSKREKALLRIESIARLCRAVGQKGLVIVFDEAETIDQLWNIRSRLSAYSVLSRLCRMPAAWCVFGTTNRFDRSLETDLNNGACEAAGSQPRDFLFRWQRREFATVEPPTMDTKSARSLARAVTSLYGVAYDRDTMTTAV